MYERTRLTGTIYTRQEMSFYAQHPDWPALLCMFLTLLIVTAGLGQKFYSRIRKRQNDD
jgi:hypothetical protein